MKKKLSLLLLIVFCVSLFNTIPMTVSASQYVPPYTLTAPSMDDRFTHSADGKTATLFAPNVTKNSGWYDTNKYWDGKDGRLCWGASCTNAITWYLDNCAYIGYGDLTGVERDRAKIFENFRNNWEPLEGYDPMQGFAWYFTGEVLSGGKPPELINYPSGGYLRQLPHCGDVWSIIDPVNDYSVVGNYQEKFPFVDDVTEMYYEGDPLYDLPTFSQTIKTQLSYGVTVLNVSGDGATATGGHAITLWGCDYDETTGYVNKIYVTDSDDEDRHPGAYLKELKIKANTKGEPGIMIEGYYLNNSATPLTKLTSSTLLYAPNVVNKIEISADKTALKSVIDFSNTLVKSDYDSNSFDEFRKVVDSNQNVLNTQVSQQKVDEATANILTAIYDLLPYLDLDVIAKDGTFTVNYNNQNNSLNNHKLVYGTVITLNAKASDGYKFDGWYEKTTKRIYSKNENLTLPITSNMKFEAMFSPTDSSTLTFTNKTGQIVKFVNRKNSQWDSVTSLNSMLPKVPYSYGYTNGKWDYNEEQILTSLRQGNDAIITPIYDKLNYEMPSIPLPDGDKPKVNLDYHLDANNNVGSFLMSVGVPNGVKLETKGVALYFDKSDVFTPNDFILTLNNKTMTSNFTDSEFDNFGIVNIHNFKKDYNWSVRAYVTYYDAQGVLQTVYSNQINIVDLQQINQ